MPITHGNHYLPRMYLKQFASKHGQLFRYRTLVSKEAVPAWKQVNVGGAGYQEHIYTRVQAEGETDDIEKWLGEDFEQPAAASIAKVVNDARLDKEDYRLLVRFAAAQYVRTPAFLIENLPRWREQTETQLKESSERIIERLKAAKEAGIPLQAPTVKNPNAEYYPIRITSEPSPDGKFVRFKTQTVVGRTTWIFAMRHLLTSTLDGLTRHRWTILSADDDLPWFTTDDPVMRLTYRSPYNYNFQGGWGVPHTNIIMPLSPKHLLFTQVGDKPPMRGTILPRDMAITLRRLFAERAHRYIFSPFPDQTIQAFRPRVVNAEAFVAEASEWRKWHAEQSAAERELLNISS